MKRTRRKIGFGRPPPAHEHPGLLATFYGYPAPDGTLEDWHLWLRAARSTSGLYWNLKLGSVNPIMGRANWWIGWDVKGARVTWRDWAIRLRAERPELMFDIEQLLLGGIPSMDTSYRMRTGYRPEGVWTVIPECCYGVCVNHSATRGSRDHASASQPDPTGETRIPPNDSDPAEIEL